ncbi:hypothetical protein Tco_0461682 [Tanacetum coccineum]
MDNTDDQPNVAAALKHEWFKKPKRALTPDSDWNIGKSVDFRPPQTWINKIAQAKKPPLFLRAYEHSYRLLSICRQVVPDDYFINNDLKYLRGGSSSKKYTTSTTKTKATKYDIKGIKDMVTSL